MLGIRLDIAVWCLEAPENWMLRGHLDGKAARSNGYSLFPFKRDVMVTKIGNVWVIGASGGARCGWE
jgi:hypothetical protein